MAELLACEAPAHTFQAVVIYAGGSSTSLRCAPPAPLSYFHPHGTVDIEVPFGGAVPGAQPPFIGAEGTLGHWAGIDGCSSSGQRETERSFGDTSVRVVSYTEGCKVPLVGGWWVQGWGHVPPPPQTQSTVDVFLTALRRVLNVTA